MVLQGTDVQGSDDPWDEREQRELELDVMRSRYEEPHILAAAPTAGGNSPEVADSYTVANEGKAASSNGKHRTTLNDLSASEWLQRTKSVMYQRGLGSNHPHTKYEHRHPCPFSYQDAERLITFFTRKSDRVLDPFAGIGSTLKAAALAERQGTGIELNRQYCEWSQERLTEEVPAALLVKYPQTVIESDVRLAIPLLPDDGFDFVLTSPPYWRILSKTPNKKASTNPALGNGAPGTLAYSEDQRDFGCIQNYENFIIEMAALVNSCRRVLKPNRYLALIVSDFRDGPVLYPYSADLITAIRQAPPENGRSFVLQGIKVLVQQNKKLYPYGYPTTYVPNIHHHYVLLYRNLGRQV